MKTHGSISSQIERALLKRDIDRLEASQPPSGLFGFQRWLWRKRLEHLKRALSELEMPFDNLRRGRN